MPKTQELIAGRADGTAVTVGEQAVARHQSKGPAKNGAFFVVGDGLWAIGYRKNPDQKDKVQIKRQSVKNI